MTVNQQPQAQTNNGIRGWFSSNTAILPTMIGLFNLFILFFGAILFFGVIGSLIFEPVDWRKLAVDVRAVNPFFHSMPDIFFFFFNSVTLKFMVAPIAGITCIWVAAACFVQDTYGLKRFRDGLHYILSAIFFMLVPSLSIENGQKDLKRGETNLIDSIGGPGILSIQTGNVAVTAELLQPNRAVGQGNILLNPFETVVETATLEDHQDLIEELKTVTVDGIQVKVVNVVYRYRLLPDNGERTTTGQTISNPFPFTGNNLLRMAFNRHVQNGAVVTWPASVRTTVRSGITDFVNSRTIDFLTSPRTDAMDPRAELRNDLLLGDIRGRLRENGTELLWIDAGHIDIIDPSVDSNRLDLWSAGWIGDANQIKAIGDAKRLAYQELGRAEAQADYILAITSSLEKFEMSKKPKEALRSLLLMRTSQLLDAMAEKMKSSDQKE